MTNQNEVKKLLDDYDKVMDYIGTCGDGNCIIKKPVGMHTNGGCRCWDDRYRAQRTMMAAYRLRLGLKKLYD